mmetsp:Transcript_39690/g.99360  ORF Transcript_39690/g.99360 Transcript_39690/m.99360 type:complete len:356 (+) Transcript_39690:1363-2430(+)
MLRPEAEVLGGHKAREENVDAIPDAKGHGHHPIGTRLAVEHADKVGEIVQNREVMLYDDDVVVLEEEGSDGLGSLDSLLDIEVGGGLIKHVDLSLLYGNHSNGKTLKLPPREILDAASKDVVEIEVGHLIVLVSPLILCGQNLANDTLDRLGDVIDVLGFDDCLDGILEDLGEEVLELAPPKVVEDLAPVGGVVKLSEVGLELSRQNFEGRRLAGAVGPYQTQHLAGAGHGHPVKLEAVGSVAVSRLLLHVFREVDDVDGSERTLLNADTAPNAELLGYPSNLRGRSHLHAQLPHADDGAELLAFLRALLGLALLVVDDRDTRQLLLLVVLLGRHVSARPPLLVCPALLALLCSF